MTKKINRIDRSTCNKVASRIHEALQPLAEEFGLVIDRGNASYTSQNFTLKLNVSLVSEDGVALTREAGAWARFAPLHGLSEDDLGRTFKNGDKEYKVVGWRSRARKRPVLTEVDGKQCVWPANTVKALLGANGNGRG